MKVRMLLDHNVCLALLAFSSSFINFDLQYTDSNQKFFDVEVGGACQNLHWFGESVNQLSICSFLSKACAWVLFFGVCGVCWHMHSLKLPVLWRLKLWFLRVVFWYELEHVLVWTWTCSGVRLNKFWCKLESVLGWRPTGKWWLIVNGKHWDDYARENRWNWRIFP